MFQIKTASLKAACVIAPTKDLRPYLKGVNILVKDDGKTYVRATDGHCAFEDEMPDICAFAPANFIIPIDVAKALSKQKKPMLQITPTADGRYECEGQIFAALSEGTFPDTGRIMPSRKPENDTIMAHYDFELVARCQKALQAATGKSGGNWRLQNSPENNAGLMYRQTAKYPRIAVMPLRDAAFKD